MAVNILLVAPETFAYPLADALRRDLNANVEVEPHRRTALAALRRSEYTLVLLEESLASLDEGSANLLYLAAGATPVMEVNFAICSAARVVRQARAALTRRNHDFEQARAAVATSLENQLSASLAGLLLESELVLRQADPVLAPKLKHLVALAGELRNQLRH